MSSSLIELLERHGIEVKPNSSDPDEFRICCPFCIEMGLDHTDERFRLGFNVVSGLGHCHHCGWSSKKALLQISRKFQLSEEVTEEIRATRFTGKTKERPTDIKLPKGFELLADYKDNDVLFGQARRYLKSRGITDRQIQEHEIGVANVWPYAGRIIFPIRDRQGTLASVQARDYTGEQEKFHNAKGSNKGIYNAFRKRYVKGVIILSEGIIKALAIERATRYKLCSGALLGHNITDLQALYLEGFTEVVLFPDPDRAGVTGFLGVAANLSSRPGLKVTLVWPLPTKQADEMSEEDIRAALRGRRLYTSMLYLRVRQELLFGV